MGFLSLSPKHLRTTEAERGEGQGCLTWPHHVPDDNKRLQVLRSATCNYTQTLTSFILLVLILLLVQILLFHCSDIYSTTPRLAESLDNIVTLGSAQSSLYNGMGGHHANPGCIVNGATGNGLNTPTSNGQRSSGGGRNSASAETSGPSLTGSVSAITTSASTSLSLTNHLDSLTDTPNKLRQGRTQFPFYVNFWDSCNCFGSANIILTWKRVSTDIVHKVSAVWDNKSGDVLPLKWGQLFQLTIKQ